MKLHHCNRENNSVMVFDFDIFFQRFEITKTICLMLKLFIYPMKDNNMNLFLLLSQFHNIAMQWWVYRYICWEYMKYGIDFDNGSPCVSMYL